jgi:hypothetical protein
MPRHRLLDVLVLCLRELKRFPSFGDRILKDVEELMDQVLLLSDYILEHRGPPFAL